MNDYVTTYCPAGHEFRFNAIDFGDDESEARKRIARILSEPPKRLVMVRCGPGGKPWRFSQSGWIVYCPKEGSVNQLELNERKSKQAIEDNRRRAEQAKKIMEFRNKSKVSS
jgi:hypothetical protein